MKSCHYTDVTRDHVVEQAVQRSAVALGSLINSEDIALYLMAQLGLQVTQFFL